MTKECDKCFGTGVQFYITPDGDEDNEPCDNCNGTGEV